MLSKLFKGVLHSLLITFIELGISCSSDRNNNSIAVSIAGDIAEETADYQPVLAKEDTNNRTDVFIKEEIPVAIAQKDLERAMKQGRLDDMTGDIYSHLRQLPGSSINRIVEGGWPLSRIIISDNNWTGEIIQTYDGDKLSYEILSDTVYYDIARKLVIDVINKSTGERLYKELTRENVRTASDENYGMFNLYGWDIISIDTEKIIIEQTITKLDSDMGDIVTVYLSKNGDITIHNLSITNEE